MRGGLMDFYQINVREIEKGPRKGEFEIYPNFIVGRSKDLMVRGRSFYAIWDEEVGLWSTDEYDLSRLVDAEMRKYAEEHYPGQNVTIRSMTNYNNKSWINYRMFVSNISDRYHQLDESLTFANQKVKQSDYVSRRLPYSLEASDCSSWNELVGTLYSVEERQKF